MACFAARADNPDRWKQACEQSPAVYCLGQCHIAPASASETIRPSVRIASSTSVLLGNVIEGGVRNLDDYLSRGGGKGITIARAMAAPDLIDLVARSGLRGRGGAGFPAARKWAAVRQSAGPPIIIVNADEGDPGAFSDKALLEDDPFRLLEAIAIAAHAIGAREAAIYLRAEYPNAARILSDALAQASAADWPGHLSITLITGEGGFVCGEETSLLNAIEGRRPFARARPPYPFQAGGGLRGRPTLVHNVETLCAVPWIVEHGPDAYCQLGRGESAGTKLISLNSLFRKPGLVEVPFGIPVRTIVEDIGGGLRRGQLIGVMIGGPLAGVLPTALLDTPFTYEDLHAVGCSVGHGGVIAFADDTSIADLIAEVFRFGAAESCGLCVPCHIGNAHIAQAFNSHPLPRGAGEGLGVRAVTEVRAASEVSEVRAASDVSEAKASQETRQPGLTRQHWDELIAALRQTSLCGHGGGLAEFALAIQRHFPEELAACLR
jgi:formate dehydrogenase iron-sulfur subunit